MYNTTNFTIPLRSRLNMITSLSYVIIELFSLCGNILVIMAICSSRRLKTNYYFLVFHVAVCDIAIILAGNMMLSLPLIQSNINISTYTTLLKISCYFVIPFTRPIFACETLFLVIIAILRYKAVAQPLRPQLSKKRLNYIVSGVYIIVFILYVPNFVLNEIKNFSCTSRWNENKYTKIYQWTWENIVTILPFTLLVVLYTKMCRSLLHHNKRIKQLFHSGVSTGNQTTVTNTAFERNYRTLITSVAIVVQFFAAVLPARVIMLLQLGGISVAEYHIQWVMLLYFLGSCTLNPVIYGLLDKTMRAAYKKCFKKTCSFFKK